MIKKILKRIFYKGCLKDLCYLILAVLFYTSPVIAKFIADFIIYKEGL